LLPLWVGLPSQTWYPSRSGLKCKDPRTIAQYNEALEAKLKRQNIPQWLEEFESNAKGHQLARAQCQLEAIDSATNGREDMPETES